MNKHKLHYRIFGALRAIGYASLGIFIAFAQMLGINNTLVFGMIVAGLVAIGSTWVCQAIRKEHYEASYYIHA